MIADGTKLAVVRRLGGKVTLEYPLGKILYETAGWLSQPWMLPDGQLVAFIDHAVARDDAGEIATVCIRQTAQEKQNDSCCFPTEPVSCFLWETQKR